MSFAIIETGGKQYKVSTSKILEIEKLDAKKGETIKFKNVLLLNDSKSTEIGNPSVEGATVEAKLLDNVKDRTILVFHKKKKEFKKKMDIDNSILKYKLQRYWLKVERLLMKLRLLKRKL